MAIQPKSHWTIAQWQAAYQNQEIELTDLLTYVSQISNADNAWISVATSVQLESQFAALAHQDKRSLPLYGIPFAVKDNIDVAGFTTTAGCPEIAYLAQQDASVVAKLKAAGAIVIGKTNLDQFATGLVGVRSPYGAVKNSFNPDYISGGSSSGSSVVVANGIVPFSLGTDTAGSGRVPAGHNNIIGLKPTKGWFSTTGVVPACRTQDVVSIFALTVDDAWQVAQLMQGYDEKDDYSRQHPATVASQFFLKKIAIPDTLEFYGDVESQAAFEVAIERMKGLGYEVEPIDFGVFNQLAQALYNDAWVAERKVAVEHYISTASIHPVVAQIIDQADKFTACDALQAEYDRAHWANQINQVLKNYDALMVPTAPTIYTIAEVEADPIVKNSHMGAYTNFVNLADLSALALPNVIRADGLPSGITLISTAWRDEALAKFGQVWQKHSQLPLGNAKSLSNLGERAINSAATINLAVAGAHLTGMPLNYQLTTRQGTLVTATKTAPFYKLFALANTTPPKPGLMYVSEGGQAIEIEIWQIPLANFGAIVAEVPAPLGIGNLLCADGQWVKGFICEPEALTTATDITEFGGWRGYMQSRAVR